MRYRLASHASFLACTALPALALLAPPSVARADDILIYQRFTNDVDGGDDAAVEAQEVLSALGHDVTVVASLTPTLPADLSVFDTIWVTQLAAISGGDQTKLRNFVNAGGGLYLTGENQACCGGVNSSLSTFVAGLASPPLPVFTPVQESASVLLANATDPFGVTSTPNAVPQWETLAAGSIAGTTSQRAVFQDASSRVGATLLVGEDLLKGAGCVYVAMDLSFWLDVVAPSQNVAPLVENIELFLEGCADSDHDGLSDLGEAGFGTDPDDPDSDDDGLCDGYGAVQGECISGESPSNDFDNDDLINPLDDDDDGDGIPTSFEIGAEDLAPNVDGDTIPAYHDLDSDGDLRTDVEEGPGDYDNDGIPAIVDEDDFPMECDGEEDCGDGLFCNLEVGFCHPEGGGEGGGGQGAGGPGGAGPGGNGAGAGPSGGNGDGAGPGAGGNAANGGGGADGGGDDGCDCATTGSSHGHGPIAAALLGAIALLLRRRRTL